MSNELQRKQLGHMIHAQQHIMRILRQGFFPSTAGDVGAAIRYLQHTTEMAENQLKALKKVEESANVAAENSPVSDSPKTE